MKFRIAMVPRNPFKWLPYRLTMPHNPAIYRWGWWNFSFDDRVGDAP